MHRPALDRLSMLPPLSSLEPDIRSDGRGGGPHPDLRRGTHLTDWPQETPR